MTIPRLDGFDDASGQSLAALTDMIGTLTKPTAKFDQQLKMMFLQKPELMQKFVDIEKANPGTLKAFGFGEGSTDLVSGMQESVEALKSRAVIPDLIERFTTKAGRKDNVEQAATGRTAAQAETDDISSWMMKEGKGLLEKDPQLFERAVRAKFGTGSKLENKVEDKTIARLDQANKLESMAPMDIVKGIKAGQYTMADVSSLILDPSRKAALDLSMRIWDQDADNETKKYLAGVRAATAMAGRKPAGSAAAENYKLRVAVDQRKAMKGNGSLAAHYKQIWGEDLPGQPAATAQDLDSIKQGLDNMQVTQRNEQVNTFRKGLIGTVTAIDKAEPENRQLYVDELNQMLQGNGSIYTAKWDERGAVRKLFTGKSRLYFERKDGYATTDIHAVAEGSTPKPEEGLFNTTSISPIARRTATGLMSMSQDEANAELKRLMAKDPTPGKEKYQEIVKAYEDAGGVVQ